MVSRTTATMTTASAATSTSPTRRTATSSTIAMIYRPWLIALLCFTTVKALQSRVDIEPKGQTAVRLGDSLKILCTMGTPLMVCRVEIPGEKGMVLSKGPTGDEIEYYGEGTEVGHCGVQIAKVKEKHDGIFKCTVTPRNERVESIATVRIIVAKAPNNPELYTNPSIHSEYRQGDKLEISCNAPSGRPAANVSLYLDDEPLGIDERPSIHDPTMDDTSLAVQNATRILDWTDNGKTLRCVANHIALDKPKETTMQLQVYYPPQAQPTIERFGYVIGREGVVNVTVYANPRPEFYWGINAEEIPEGRTDDSTRIQTSSAMDMGKGAWLLILKINNVQKSDTEKDYVLKAKNREGSTEYRIVLSTSSEPAGVDLDAGSIIGIVVGVLVLILIVFLVIFARATGRWCFAGGSTSRNLGESSDTESAGRYSRTEADGAGIKRGRESKLSLSQLFRRNKDKVSGADTDTMRTVVTVDDEKLQVTDPTTQDSQTNVPVGEGGIVYAELDLTQQQQGVAPRRINEDKTEYAEILYTKTEAEEEAANK